uniref:Uncharacterized protein n=1 Tax=Zonotrichia albicollis TaxID=44394 RepID=A0A8D2N4T7_ZONAL
LQKSERQGLLLALWQLPVSLFPAAADPVTMAPESLETGTWCNEHMLHERLDIIEEKVIKTVEHLESEVKSLLNIISETTVNIPTVPGTPLIDIFDGQYLVRYNLS